MSFVLQEVIEELEGFRSLEPLKKLNQENLAKVAAHYGIITGCTICGSSKSLRVKTG